MKFRILLVDDHELVRMGLKTLLERYPQFEIVGEAASAQEAYDKTMYCKPDIVVMDINMPDMDGIAAAAPEMAAGAAIVA